MPFGDPGSNFAGTGGYGGQFPGYGGASAGYTGGYGNPSSVGGGTAGQTYAGQAYANTLNKYNPSLANYSGVGSGNNIGSALDPNSAMSIATAAAKKSKGKGFQRLYPTTPPAVAPTTAPAPVSTKPVSGFNPNDWASPGYGNYDPGWNNPVQQPTGGFQPNYNNFVGNAWAGEGAKDYNVNPGVAGRQFGGPVGPGQQYTVGENGPETLQMGAQGGQVIPHNPVDRLGGMNPGMMQALFQLMQQRRPQMNPGQAPVGQPAPQMPPPPQMQPPMGQGQGPGGPGGPGGGFRLGDWRNRMGIAGLSRPAQQPGIGFGGSGLGVPGIMPQMQQRLG